MLRMVALVSLEPGTDVDATLDRLQAMLAEDENVEAAEIGPCLAIRGDPVANYAMVLAFADRAAFERYSAGDAHQQFAQALRPSLRSWTAAFFETSGRPSATTTTSPHHAR